MHMSYNRKVGLVGFAQLLSYLGSEWACIHLHVLQPLWKTDLESIQCIPAGTLQEPSSHPEEYERWVRACRNGAGLCQHEDGHVINASEAYLVSVSRCAFKYTSAVKLRPITPLFQSRKIPTLSIVFQPISQATELITFMAAPAGQQGRAPGRYIPPQTRCWRITDEIILRGNEVPSRLQGQKICFCGKTLLSQAWWEQTHYSPPSLGPQHCLHCKVQYKYSYHIRLKQALVHSVPIPSSFCTHFTMR